MNLDNIHIIFHSNRTEYIFFSAAHWTFFKIEQILENKGNINWHEKTEITPFILSKTHGLKKAYTGMETEQPMAN